MFKLPSLPKEWYEVLQRVAVGHEMTQWQVIILALRALLDEGGTFPERVQQWATEIKAQYPRPEWGARKTE